MKEDVNSQHSKQATPFGQGALQSRLHEPAPLLHGLAQEKEKRRRASKAEHNIRRHKKPEDFKTSRHTSKHRKSARAQACLHLKHEAKHKEMMKQEADSQEEKTQLHCAFDPGTIVLQRMAQCSLHQLYTCEAFESANVGRRSDDCAIHDRHEKKDLPSALAVHPAGQLRRRTSNKFK